MQFRVSPAGIRALMVPVAVVLLLTMATSAGANPRRPARGSRTAPSIALAVAGGTVFAGGEFTGFWPPGRLASLGLYDHWRRTPTVTFPSVAGTVESVVGDGSGGWFVGGSFRSIAGLNCRNLVHVRTNGTIDRGWCPRPGAVLGLVRHGAALYFGASPARLSP